MPKWEYKLVRFFQDGSESDEETEQRLNRLGEEGWEIVGALPDQVSDYVAWLAKRQNWGDPDMEIPY